jgi:nitroreductase
MPSRKAVIAGSAGTLALTALAYRAWDRGAFAGATGPAYAPWDEWPGSASDGDRRPLRSAILAASPHDTQPWSFVVSPGSIAVYADRARHLGTFDPFRREMHLGLGCAIENLALAARVFGMKAEVRAVEGRLELDPEPHPALAARIALTVGEAKSDALFNAIPMRHTNRGPYFRNQPIAPERLKRLLDHVSDPSVRVVFVAEEGARGELSAIVVEATERIIADAEMSRDSFRWTRTGKREILDHRDGVTLDTFGANRLITTAGKLLPDPGQKMTDRLWLKATRDVHTATAPVLGMILVPDRLDMVQSIAAGRAWQRLHLAATVEGLAAQPLNQPVEMIDRRQMLNRPDEFGPALTRLAGADGWEPTFVFRLGYASREAPRSPRRQLEHVVTEQAGERGG